MATVDGPLQCTAWLATSTLALQVITRTTDEGKQEPFEIAVVEAKQEFMGSVIDDHGGPPHKWLTCLPVIRYDVREADVDLVSFALAPGKLLATFFFKAKWPFWVPPDSPY